MAKISLKTLTDDILLLVRNNNISESEDLSRAQIHSWIKAYKNQIWKEERERRKLIAKQYGFDSELTDDDEFIKRVEVGPLALEEVKSKSDKPIYTKRTVAELQDVLDNSPQSILAIHDQEGENIQYMDHIRRHYNYWRRYTFGELTGYYSDDRHVYIQGLNDKGELKYIYVLFLQEVKDDTADGSEDTPDDEDSVEIPAWMIPGIKERIIKNELAFMLNRPSDDSNNATLASVKPHGPQYEEE
jgi:hypothetical protein